MDPFISFWHGKGSVNDLRHSNVQINSLRHSRGISFSASGKQGTWGMEIYNFVSLWQYKVSVSYLWHGKG